MRSVPEQIMLIAPNILIIKLLNNLSDARAQRVQHLLQPASPPALTIPKNEKQKRCGLRHPLHFVNHSLTNTFEKGQ